MSNEVGQKCIQQVENDFRPQPVLLSGCSAADLACLCADSSPTSFSTFYLDSICNRCDIIPGVQIDPIAELALLCPDQAALRGNEYSCSYFAPDPKSETTTTPVSSIIQPTSSAVSSATITSGVSPTLSTWTILASHPTLISTTTSEAPLLTSTSSPESSWAKNSKQTLSTGAIAGIAIGAAIVVIIALALGWFFIYRKRQSLKWPLGRSELDGNPQPHLDSQGKPRELETKEAPQELEGNGIKWINEPPT